MSEPSNNPQGDGHSTTVTHPSGVIRGPFLTVRQALQCVEEWRLEPSEVVETQETIEDIEPGDGPEDSE